MKINNLEITRKIVQIATALTVVGCVPLAIFTPWSKERIIEDYGLYGSITWVFHFNIYIAIAYFLPVVGSLFTNGSVKRYFKRRRAEINPQFCIVCGKPNNSKGKFCDYCGTNL